MGDNDNKNKRALLIGIDHYPDFKGALRAEEDQDLIANTFRNLREGSEVRWGSTLGVEPELPRGPLDVGNVCRWLQDNPKSYFTLIIDRSEGGGDLVFTSPASHAGSVGGKKDASRGARLLDLLKALDELDGSIREEPAFSEDQKADIAGDLLTIRAQVAKRNPIPDIVMAAWVSFKSMAGPVGAGEAARRVAYLLQRFL